MMAFERFVEMPLSKRGDSYAPANCAEDVTPGEVASRQRRRRSQNVTHVTRGTMWGAAQGIAPKALRGQNAVHVVYAGDVLVNTQLGRYPPTKWSNDGLATDLQDMYLQAQATSPVLDRLLDLGR